MFEMPKTPGSELYRRIKALQTCLSESDIDGALIVHNANLFYFSGAIQSAYLFIPQDGEPLYFVRKNHERALVESELHLVIPIGGLAELPKRLTDYGYTKIKTLGMELDILPVNHYFRYLDRLKPVKIVDIWPSVQKIRAVKSDYEIVLLKDVAALSDFMVETGRKHLREGMMEIELAAVVETAARMRGHEGFVRMRTFNQELYWGHLISGPDAAYSTFIESATGGRGLSHAFPQGAGRRSIMRNEPVIFDLLACMQGYLIDQTRTLSLGPLPEKLKNAHLAAMEIEEALEEMMKPGTPVNALFTQAQHIAEAWGLSEHFMGFGKRRVAFCGHGIGLEVDEFPAITENSRTILLTGMVLVLEPKFHFPREGVVGVEDTYVVTEKRGLKLTRAPYVIDVTV
jgi:Xaa-Pro dipeptidase